MDHTPYLTFPPVLSPSTGMVEDVCLPYSSMLQHSPVKMDEIRELVVSHDVRPPVPDQWNRDEVCSLSCSDHSLPHSDNLQPLKFNPSSPIFYAIVFNFPLFPQNMRIILRTITECWHGNSTVRLTPLRVKKTLWKLSQQIQPKMYDKNGKLLSIDGTNMTTSPSAADTERESPSLR